MRRLLACSILIGTSLVGFFPVTAQETGAEPEEPHPTDLVETTEARLVQLDVTVTGPPETIADLQPEDFRLVIGLQKVEQFIVDNICVLPGDPGAREVEVTLEEPTGPAPTPPPPSRSRPTTNFLFYFDQHHLTMAGRARSIDLAQELIPDLVVDGNRAMIVSAGQSLETFADLTDDPAELMQALRALNADHTQWDPWVQQEESRIVEIIEILNENESADVGRAVQVARGHQREERWRSQKALHLFSMILGHMGELDPPKAVVYFADTMRSNAGDHYLSFFSRRMEESPGDTRFMQAFTAAHAFDRVVAEATALGIRVFTVEARGLMGPPNIGIASETAAGTSSPVANTRAYRDAQNALVGLAAESGGRAFLNGVRARKIAARIREDLSCVYLLSFDASHLRENTSHRAVVKVDRQGVKVHARGQITVQSESRRLTSRLMSAFASPQTMRSRMPVTGVIIPTGYAKGKYSALVQLHVPGSPLSAAAWDLGLSLISRGEVAADASGRISVSGPGVPVVLETLMEFRPGPFKLIGVAHETSSNDMGTGEVESDWADPDHASVTLGPVAVMQPGPAAILRDHALKSEGAIGIGAGGLARTDRPTALIGLVCRARNQKGKLRVERRLVGAESSSAPFGTLRLDLGGERCAQIRDFIPAGSMSSGMFSYEIRVFDKKTEVASTVRQFAAASPDEHPGAAGRTGP